MPLSFEANVGQTDAQVNYLSRGVGYALFLTPSEAVLSLQSSSPNDGGANRAGTASTLTMQLEVPRTPSWRSSTPIPR